MSKTTNCNIYKDKDFVYCGRGKGILNNPINCKFNDYGVFGNPVAINSKCPVCESVHVNGGSTLPCYEKYLRNRLSTDPDFKDAFFKLKGKKLGCFCKPKPCHTDIMIKFLDGEIDL